MNELGKQIDGREIYRHLADNRQALDGSILLDEPRVQQRLKQRAEQLSRRGSDQQRRGEAVRVFVFELGSHRFAFELNRVAKVVRLENFVPLSGGSPYLLGVANIDGDVRSLVDLRPLLGIESARESIAYLLMLPWQQTEVGICADDVVEVISFDREEIRQPEDRTAETLRWSLGIGPDGTVWLDADKLFACLADGHSLN